MARTEITNIEPGEVRCDTAAEGAALGLLGLMTGISEQYWHAGWLLNLEHDLWNASPGTVYGHGIISERQCQLLRLLSEECSGWWIWDDGEKFVPLAEWEVIRSKRK